MYEEKNNAESFCRAIIGINIEYSKVLANLVMALSSYSGAKSVVGLSESPVFHFQYSSISDLISHLSKDKKGYTLVQEAFQKFYVPYLEVHEVNHFQTDGVNIFREHSACLENRQLKYKPNNQIVGNKPLGVGYAYSFVNFADLNSCWSVPYEIQRLEVADNLVSVGASQLLKICQSVPFAKSLNVNAADSSYGCAKYLSPTSKQPNLVSIVRLRHGNKVYPKWEGKPLLGCPKIYGEVSYLIEESGKKSYLKKEKAYEKQQKAIYETPADEFLVMESKTSKGRLLKIELSRWKNHLLRSKKGFSMKESVFDLVGVRVLDATDGKRVFQKDMFISVVGERREEVVLREVFNEFRHRFDLEVTNRFCKQSLLMESFQTPKVEHLDNWMLVVQMAMWLLFVSSKEVGFQCHKWQKYSQPKREENLPKTACQTKKASEKLFCQFDPTPFLPQKSKKSEKRKGRQKGQKQVPRKRFPILKKNKKEVKIE